MTHTTPAQNQSKINPQTWGKQSQLLGKYRMIRIAHGLDGDLGTLQDPAFETKALPRSFD